MRRWLMIGVVGCSVFASCSTGGDAVETATSDDVNATESDATTAPPAALPSETTTATTEITSATTAESETTGAPSTVAQAGTEPDTEPAASVVSPFGDQQERVAEMLALDGAACRDVTRPLRWLTIHEVRLLPVLHGLGDVILLCDENLAAVADAPVCAPDQTDAVVASLTGGNHQPVRPSLSGSAVCTAAPSADIVVADGPTDDDLRIGVGEWFFEEADIEARSLELTGEFLDAPNGTRRYLGPSERARIGVAVDGLKYGYDMLQIEYDLIIAGTWEGEVDLGTNRGGPTLGTFGTALQGVIDAPGVPEASFSTDPSASQTWGGESGIGEFEAFTGASEVDTLGWGLIGQRDSVYRVIEVVPNSGTRYSFSAAGYPSDHLGVWGIDELRIGAFYDDPGDYRSYLRVAIDDGRIRVVGALATEEQRTATIDGINEFNPGVVDLIDIDVVGGWPPRWSWGSIGSSIAGMFEQEPRDFEWLLGTHSGVLSGRVTTETAFNGIMSRAFAGGVSADPRRLVVAPD